MATGTTPKGLPLEEAQIQERLAAARRRLEADAGLAGEPAPEHYATPAQRPFLASERPHTTLLFGGLTWKHDSLIQSSLEALGYRCQALPTPDVRAFQLGREFGNISGRRALRITLQKAANRISSSARFVPNNLVYLGGEEVSHGGLTIKTSKSVNLT